MIKKPFTQAEMEHLRCNAECQRDIAIMAFLYSTAARIGEVVRLNRKDIDWGNKEVIIYGEKGKKERRVYLTDDCAYHLHKYLLHGMILIRLVCLEQETTHPPGEAGNPVHVANPRTEDRNPCSPTQVQENTVDRCRKPRNPTTGDPDVRRTSEA